MRRASERVGEAGRVEDAFLLLTSRYIGVDCTAAAVFYAFSPLARDPPFLILYYSDVLNGVSYQFRQFLSIICAATQNNGDCDTVAFYKRRSRRRRCRKLSYFREGYFTRFLERERWIKQRLMNVRFALCKTQSIRRQEFIINFREFVQK